MNQEEIVLKALEAGPKSVRELMAEHIELFDRAKTSLLLHGMMKAGKVQRTGHTHKWELVNAPSEATEQSAQIVPIAAQENTLIAQIEPPAENFSPVAVSIYSAPNNGLTGSDITLSPPSPPPPEVNLNAIFAVQKIIHPDASLVIEKQDVFIYFAGNQYRVKNADDIEACMRMCECFVGKAA